MVIDNASSDDSARILSEYADDKGYIFMQIILMLVMRLEIISALDMVSNMDMFIVGF